MLDTNMVSHLINQRPSVVGRVVAISMASLCISAIPAGELLCLVWRSDPQRRGCTSPSGNCFAASTFSAGTTPLQRCMEPSGPI
jgi:hypothetical protein